MLKIENTEVTGWEAAIRGMRNPMNSWEKSDSILSKMASIMISVVTVVLIMEQLLILRHFSKLEKKTSTL